MLTIALAAMDSTIVATAIPSIASELGNFALFPWVFSSYLLAAAVMVPIYGKLADIFGRRPVLVIGTSIFIAGSLLCGMAWSMVTLIAFRVVQGLGAGAIQPITSTIVGDLYDVADRGRVQGWLSSVFGMAAVIGPAVGGILVQFASWRWIFLLNLPVGIAALLVVSRNLQESVPSRRPSIDVRGALLLILSVGLAILGLLEGGVRWSWYSSPSLTIFGLASAALVAFVFVERRAAEPMVPLWVFSRRVLLGSNIAGGIVVGMLAIGLITFLPTFAQNVLGASAIVAGFALSVMSIAWPLAAWVSALLYQRFGFRDTAGLGAVICLASGAIFVSLPEDAAIWQLGAGSFVMGWGLGMLAVPLVVGVQSLVAWERRGVVTGSMMFQRALGRAFGTAVFGALAHSAGTATSGHGLFVSTHRVFVGLVVVALVGIVALAFTPRRFQALQFDEPALPSES